MKSLTYRSNIKHMYDIHGIINILNWFLIFEDDIQYFISIRMGPRRAWQYIYIGTCNSIYLYSYPAIQFVQGHSLTDYKTGVQASQSFSLSLSLNRYKLKPLYKIYMGALQSMIVVKISINNELIIQLLEHTCWTVPLISYFYLQSKQYGVQI